MSRSEGSVQSKNEQGLIRGAIILFLLAVCIVGGGVFAVTHHVVKTEDDGYKMYFKEGMSLKNYYLDLTGLDVIDLCEHRELVRAMEKEEDLGLLPYGTIFTQASLFGVSADTLLDKFQKIADMKAEASVAQKSMAEKAQEIGENVSVKAGEISEGVSGKVDEYSKILKQKKEKLEDWLKEMKADE